MNETVRFGAKLVLKLFSSDSEMETYLAVGVLVIGAVLFWSGTDR